MEKYPEHEKLQKIQEFSQTCGEFVAWLHREKKIQFARFQGEPGWESLYLEHTSIEDLLAEFFDINQDKLEKEKREMLAKLREVNP